MENNNEKFAALYCRVSTDAQYEEGYSIDAQKELLEAYCKSKKISNYRFFVDGGYSGSNLNRPQMQEMIQLAIDNKISTVIVYKLDRISRSQKDTLYLIEDVFLPNNVDFISMNESFDTSTPFGKAMIGILSVFAQLERDNIKMRTRMGMRKRMEEGYWMGGGRIPYGYDYDQDQGILVPNQNADKVRQMYKMFLDGSSCDRIAKVFGLKYDRLVYQILSRKSNTGVIVYNGEEFKGKHEAIISEDIYNQTIEELKRRSLTKSSPSNQYLLTGLMYCGKCGAKMRYQKWNKTEAKIYCYSQQRSKEYLVKDPNCDNTKHWASEIESAVLEDFFKHISISKDTTRDKERDDSALKILVDRKKELEQKIKNLYILFSKDADEMLVSLIQDSKKDLEEINLMIERENERNEILWRQVNTIDSFSCLEDSWQYMNVQEKRNILLNCISKIIITGDRVSVYYNF